jgi:hypothetical protein
MLWWETLRVWYIPGDNIDALLNYWTSIWCQPMHGWKRVHIDHCYGQFETLQNSNEVLGCFMTIGDAYPCDLLTYLLHVSSSLWRSVGNWSFRVQNFVFLGVKDTDAKLNAEGPIFCHSRGEFFCCSTRSWFAIGSYWINVSLNSRVGAF